LSEAKEGSSRRDFLKIAGSFAAGAIAVGAAVAAIQPAKGPAVTQTVTATVTETGPAMTSGDVNAFRVALERDGFIVQEGKFGVFDIIEMYDAGFIPMCWGNNPSTPYMVAKLPMAPGQTVPNTLSDVVINPANKGLWNDWRLRPDEAMVFVGRTPPAVSYFSYRSYLGLRYFPNEGRSRRVFASLGDTINHLTIKTSGTPNGAEGNPFGQDTIIVTTADKGIDDRVRMAAQSAGYSPAIMNTDVIPSELVNMGLEKEDDDFVFIHRIAFFQDEDAGDAYMKNAGAVVFRLTPKEPTPLLPYGVQPLRVRGTGDTTELDLLDAMGDLRQAILAKHTSLKAIDLNTSVWLFEGFDAIQRGVDVIGENRDTTYLASERFTLNDDPDEFLIVYGVNHAATGKVTYSNFGIYGADIVNGIGAVASQSLSGTAEEYIPGHPAAKYLYVWKVARKSRGDPRCLEVPWSIGAAGIDLDNECFVGFRAYVEKETKVGPFWSEILYDRAIKFGPKV